MKGIPPLARSTVVEKWAAGSAWRIGESNFRKARGDKYEDGILWLKKSMPLDTPCGSGYVSLGLGTQRVTFAPRARKKDSPLTPLHPTTATDNLRGIFFFF